MLTSFFNLRRSKVNLDTIDWKSSSKSTKIETTILERIICSYHKAVSDEEESNIVRGGMWNRFRTQYKADFIKILNKKNPKELNEYLSNMPNNGAGFGCYSKIETTGEHLLDTSQQKKVGLAWTLDTIYGFSEALGLCPEICFSWAAYWQSVLNVDLIPTPKQVCTIIEQIEQEIGVPLNTPSVCSGIYGIPYKEGIITGRANLAAYMAWKIKHIINEQSLTSKVCEIGPGVGLLCYFLYQFNIKNTTLIDLPEMNVIQAFYLAQALPHADITLYGEPVDFNAETIKILPDFHFLTRVKEHFGLVVNQDSMPEINFQIVNLYLDKISKFADSYFSFNQETFTTNIHHDISTTFYKDINNVNFLSTMKLKERNKSWMRQGYVEQLFLKKT